MKGSWPQVTALLRFDFAADHAMPRIGSGCEVRHTHHYVVQFGWTHEIAPIHGYTHEMREQREDFAALIERLDGQYLNDVLPMQPSAEVIALWLLCQTQPAACDHVIVEADYGLTARADRSRQRSEWTEFLAGRAPDPFSNSAFTLK